MEGRQRLRYYDRFDYRSGAKFWQFCGSEIFFQVATSPHTTSYATPGDFLEWLVVPFVRSNAPLDTWPFIFRDVVYETHHPQIVPFNSDSYLPTSSS
jgi:hypothetical protein